MKADKIKALRAYCPNIYTVPGTLGDNGLIFIQIGMGQSKFFEKFLDVFGEFLP